MARIRTIKPEFWSSEQVMDLSLQARLLFIGMWNFCDDGGNHVASPKTLKANVLPGDEILIATVQRLVDELIAVGLVAEYEANGKWYWHVTGWQHQKIDKPNFKHPAPPRNPHETWPRRPIVDESSNDRRMVDDHSPPEGKGMEGNGEGREGNEAAAATPPPRVPACEGAPAPAHVSEATPPPVSSTDLVLAAPAPAPAPAAAPPAVAPGPSREVQLAVLVRNLERARGKQCRVNASDPQVAGWVRDGVTDDQLAEACALAAADREAHEDLTPLNAGFVDVFVAKLLHAGAGKATAGRAKGGGLPSQRTEQQRQDDNDKAFELAFGRKRGVTIDA